MLIIHEPDHGTRRRLPQSLRDADPVLALAGPVDAFDDAAPGLHSGRVGGAHTRFTHVGPPRSAFAVLHDCATLCGPRLAEALRALRYVRLQAGAVPQPLLPGSGAAVRWDHGADGTVIRFALAPLVASSPLLRPVLEGLAAAPLSDEARFAHLAAAFAGYGQEAE